MNLPSDFIARMRELLGGTEAASLFDALQEPPVVGLRVNALKITPDSLRKLAPWEMSPAPFPPSGFVLEPNTGAGKHPFHAAGLYYLQEPSAMAAAEIIRPQPGETVLDLCAAPGGKSTHIAALTRDAGLLVCNEFERSRVGSLLSNLERCGVTRSIVTNESAEMLAQKWSGWFDKVLVDAPCSGEGMFRKGDEAARHYGLANIQLCAVRQRQLLSHAADLLRPGGVLAYSTCTFAPEEDEQTVAAFLNARPDFEILPVPQTNGAEPGRPEWAGGDGRVAHCLRLWPHRVRGEGHFIALFRRREDSAEITGMSAETLPDAPPDSRTLWDDFAQNTLLPDSPVPAPDAQIRQYGDNLYAVPSGVPAFAGLSVIRAGLWLGTVLKGRFAPSHALALAVRAENCPNRVDFAPDSPPIAAYIRGETLEDAGEAGWVLMCVAGFPIGWAKRAQNILKNHYPKGLRRPA